MYYAQHHIEKINYFEKKTNSQLALYLKYIVFKLDRKGKITSETVKYI